jgi:glycosyltransferase 2 family protein
MADDRRVGEDVQGLRGKRPEGRQREADDLAIVGGAKTHRVADDNGAMQPANEPSDEPNRLLRLPLNRVARVALGLLFLGAVAGVLWWRHDSLASIGDAFRAVRWEWVAVAIALNLLSVVARALAWTTVIHSAMEEPHPRIALVFSAFSVGLFANAVLPGRIGELARVAVLTRKLPKRKGTWATLVGTVFAHRVFDIVPVLLLILYVVLTAGIPNSFARASLLALIGVGVGLFAFAFLTARRHTLISLEGLGPVRRLLTMGRAGLGVMRSPVGTAGAVFFQFCGWLCQLFAVYTAMRAFGIHPPLPAAGVVLLVMNVVTIFPFWPGNVGLLQVAIASTLVGYGVSYSVGVAYGFGLQAIEASVGIGVGLLFLAREGLSFAMLRVMPSANQAELPDERVREDVGRRAESATAR